MNILPSDMKFGTRQPVKRLEDERLITGRGRYTDDRESEGALWLYILRSPHAHARILSIETGAALESPGIAAVYTGADLAKENVGTLPTLPIFKRPDGSDASFPPRRLLAHEIVRFAGEPVAAVIAETRQAAQDAAEAIAVEYDVLAAVADVQSALAPDAPRVWSEVPDNIAAAASYGDAAAVDAAFANAAHVVALDLGNQRLVPNAIEPRANLAEPDLASGRLTLRVPSQTPATTRDILAGVILKRPPDSIRVLVGDIGGGFGHKTGLYPEDGLVAYAATKLHKAVRWRADRIDDFLSGTHGRDLVTHAELAFDANGRILAFRAKATGNTGAYLSGTGNIIPLVLGPFVSTGLYDIPLVRMETQSVMTNTAPIGAYRGAGRPEAIFTIERMMDAAARQMKMDPRDLRKINFVKSEQMPFTNFMGQTYDSGNFAKLIDRASEASDWAGFEARKAAAQAKGLLYGRGLASYIEWTGGNALVEPAKLHVTGDGRAIIISATQAMGQGLETSYAQMVAQALSIPIENVEVVQGDTDLVQGFGSVGSRSLYIGGSAVAASVADLVEKARPLAAEMLEAATQDLEFADGRFRIAGTDRQITLAEIAAKQPESRLSVSSEGKVDGPSWPNGTHVAEVEVDPDTGVVRIARYTTVDDVGVPMNPMLVEGQMHGGIVQGAGQTLYEGAVYNEEGQLLTATFMDYQMPRAEDFPFFKTELDETSPSKINPLGAKGCGESGTVGATPTVLNAVIDALAPYGIKHLDMPLTPAKVWQAIATADPAPKMQ
jgi:carbon-monoxide dehydrogenase large subunit